MIRLWMAASAVLALAACGGGGPDGNEAAPAAESANVAEAETTETAENNRTGAASPSAAGGMTGCPFRETHNLAASIEGGRVLVTGNVDFLMAGFKPELSRRADSAPPVLRVDLKLAPAPGEPVNDELRFEAPAGRGYRQLQIFCGGDAIETVDMVVI